VFTHRARGSVRPVRIAILDDYQNVALSFADWTSLNAEIEVFTEPIPAGEVPARLAGFDVVVAMRERTLFGAEVRRALPDLRLLVSTGRGNAAIALDAARAAGPV